MATPSLPNPPWRTTTTGHFNMPTPSAHSSKDGLRIIKSAIAIAVTEQQSLLAWLHDPKGQGKGSGRTRIFCEDAVDSIALAISLYVPGVKMVIGGGKYMADCLSDFRAMAFTCSDEVEAPQTWTRLN